MSKRAIVLAAIIFGIRLASAQTPTLTQRIDRRIDVAGLDRNFWGIAVTDIDGKLLYGRNAERLFMPASNTKLAVTTAALSLLGPEFRTTTSVYATGPVEGNTLHGDLILYGRGDPTFSRRCYDSDSTRAGACDKDPAVHLAELAQQLASQGIRTIQGDLIGDGTWFEDQRIHRTWENYDLGWYFAAPVAGLGFNDNAIDVHTTAGRTVGSGPTISLVPDLNYASFSSKATTGDAASKRTYDIFRSPDGLSYSTTGSVPLGTSMVEFPAVAEPDRYTAVAFRAALAAAGIAVNGSVRIAKDSNQTLAARKQPALAEIRSRPLREWLFPILDASQNLFAETLLKDLGRQLGSAGSWMAGISVERRFFIDSLRIDSTQFTLVDGSGLSDKNLVTPLAFTTMLRRLWRSPNRDLILRNLPRAGQVGTLSRRFVGTPLAGRVHAKSGAIGGVNALSGYVERPDGKVYVFSIITNNHTIGSARMIAAIDNVVLEIGK